MAEGNLHDSIAKQTKNLPAFRRRYLNLPHYEYWKTDEDKVCDNIHDTVENMQCLLINTLSGSREPGIG